MPNGFFITGTDTNIGKTVVATILARGLAAKYWKPIQTGLSEGRDADFVGQWIGKEQICPEVYALAAPLSPHVAAEKVNVEIQLDRILAARREITGPLIVEGAGGVLVPLNRKQLMVHLMQALQLPAIIVCRSSLGTINHTCLSIEALRARGIAIQGVIMVGEPNESNRRAIEEFGKVSVIGEVSVCSAFSMQWFQESFHKISLVPNVPHH